MGTGERPIEVVQANSTVAAMGTFETYCVPGTVSSILHPHSVLEDWHYLSPFLQMGENETHRREATSPSKGDRHILD